MELNRMTDEQLAFEFILGRRSITALASVPGMTRRRAVRVLRLLDARESLLYPFVSAHRKACWLANACAAQNGGVDLHQWLATYEARASEVVNGR